MTWGADATSVPLDTGWTWGSGTQVTSLPALGGAGETRECGARLRCGPWASKPGCGRHACWSTWWCCSAPGGSLLRVYWATKTTGAAGVEGPGEERPWDLQHQGWRRLKPDSWNLRGRIGSRVVVVVVVMIGPWTFRVLKEEEWRGY